MYNDRVRRVAATPALHVWIEFELSVVLGAIVVDDLFCNGKKREQNNEQRETCANARSGASLLNIDLHVFFPFFSSNPLEPNDARAHFDWSNQQ